MTKVYKIGACAGHGKNTPGKRSPSDEREWYFNNIVITAFENELLKYKNVEFKRFDDRTGNTDIPLVTRTNQANSWGADYYISFHHNALKDDGIYREHTGVETFVYSLTKSVEAVKLAEALHPSVVSSYALRNRGIKEGNLHIVRETKMPAVLIEGGFMDSSIDIYKLRSKQVLESVGINVAKALANYLKLEKKQTTTITVDIGKEVGKMKLCEFLSTYQINELKDVYEKAYNNGTFSTKWHEKVADKTISVGDAIYLNAVLIDRYNEK